MEASYSERTALLTGTEQLARYEQAHVLIVGLGGVGGIIVEMLARAGVGHFTLVDGDSVSASNINRQVLAFPDNIGVSKASLAKELVLRINPSAAVSCIEKYLACDDIAPLLALDRYDFIVDAIDTIAPKTELLIRSYQSHFPIVSSMGAGAKRDPQSVRIADISQSNHCSLAKIIRRNLREAGINEGIPVVYSIEAPIKQAVLSNSLERNKRTTVGTISYLPNVFGCFIASHVLSNL